MIGKCFNWPHFSHIFLDAGGGGGGGGGGEVGCGEIGCGEVGCGDDIGVGVGVGVGIDGCVGDDVGNGVTFSLQQQQNKELIQHFLKFIFF
jgi:hypothetical protein